MALIRFMVIFVIHGAQTPIVLAHGCGPQAGELSEEDVSFLQTIPHVRRVKSNDRAAVGKTSIAEVAWRFAGSKACDTLEKHARLDFTAMLSAAAFVSGVVVFYAVGTSFNKGLDDDPQPQEPQAALACHTVKDRLARWSRVTPEKLLYTYVDSNGDEIARLSYRAVHVQSSALAWRMLHEWDMKPGDRALLVYPPCVDFNIAFLACLGAGVVAVPVFSPDPSNLVPDLSKLTALTNDSGARVALTSLNLNKKTSLSSWGGWPDMSWHMTDTTGSDFEPQGQYHDDPSIPFESLAFLQYTSGSTGDPKGVMISHSNLVHNISLHVAPNQSVFVTWLPQYHDMGLVGGNLITVFYGCACVQISPSNFMKRPILWLEMMTRYRATHTTSPNCGYVLAARALKQHPDAGALDLSSLEVVGNASEMIPPATQTAFLATLMQYGLREGSYYPFYGMAEHTCMLSGMGAKVVTHRGRVSVGVPLSTPAGHVVTVRIVDPDTCVEVPDGTEGEIWVDSPSKAGGYWNKLELTEEVFNAQLRGSDGLVCVCGQPGQGFHRTGDLGFMLDGLLFVCGRIKNIIIIGGVKYHPHDIEQTIAKTGSPYLRPGCALAVALLGDIERLIIVAEVRDPEARPTDLAESLKREVEKEHGIPVYGLSLLGPGSIPKTSSGKLRHRMVAELWAQEDRLNSELERRVWESWVCSFTS